MSAESRPKPVVLGSDEGVIHATDSTQLRDQAINRGTAWVLLANVVFGASQWVMLMILTRFGSPTTAGQFVLALAITAPVMLFFGMQLRFAQACDQSHQSQTRDFLMLRAVTAVIGVASILTFVRFSAYYGSNTGRVIVIVAVWKGVDCMIDQVYGGFQQTGHTEYMAWSMLLRGPLAVVGFAVGFLGFGSVEYGCAGILLASCTMLLLWDLPLKKRTAHDGYADLRLTSSSFDRLRALAGASLPLGISALLASVNTNIPRYFLESSAGLHELGIFGAIAYMHVVGYTAISAICEAALPHLASLWRTDKFQFGVLARKLAGRALLVGIVVVIGSLLFGGAILNLAYGKGYEAEHRLLTIQMSASALIFVATVGANVLVAVNQYNAQLRIYMVTIVVTVVSCFVLIPRFGLVGASSSCVISALVQLILTAILVRSSLRVTSGSQTQTRLDG